MGSDSDLPTMRAAGEVLRDFGVPCEVTVVSAHRTPVRLLEYGQNAHKRGLKVGAPTRLAGSVPWWDGVRWTMHGQFCWWVGCGEKL